MISLSQYINEALVLESFTVAYQTYDDMIKDNNFLSCVKKLTHEEQVEFKSFIEYITKDLDVTDVFKVDKEKRQIIFKLNYKCVFFIDKYIDAYINKEEQNKNKVVEVGNIVIDRSNSKKYFVSFRTSNSKKADRKKVKMFELGEGVTASKTKPENQEEALCILWNCLMDLLEAKNDIDIFKYDEKHWAGSLSDYMIKSNVVKAEWDKGWLVSYFKIIKVIYTFIQKFLKDSKKGLTPLSEDITKYRLCKYDASDIYNSRIGEEYKTFVEQYKKIYNVRKKDAYDPTDVLLYRKDKVSDIVTKLKGYKSSDEEQLMKNKTDFLDTLFKKKFLCGISLKKIPKNLSNATYVLFNCGVDNIGLIDSYKKKEDTESRGNNYFVKATGNFDLNGVTSVDKQQQQPNTQNLGDTKEMQVMMRSFGSNIVGMDCTLTKRTTASIGKCPALIWREILSDDAIDLNEYISDPKTNIEQFRKFVNKELVFDDGETTRNGIKVNTEQYVIDGITRIIRGSLKEGQKCFPFILIH